MTTATELQVNTVTGPPDYIQAAANGAGSGDGHGELGQALASVAALKAATSAAVLAPASLPSGYSFEGGSTQRGGDVATSTYAGPNGALTVSSGASVKDDPIDLMEGTYEKIDVAGATDAYYVKGTWAIDVREPNNPSIFWDSSASSKIIMVRDGGLVILRGRPSAEWSKETLTTIAESLEPA